jgi:hypothetical protein
MGFDHLRRHKMQVALGAEAETAAQGLNLGQADAAVHFTGADRPGTGAG